MVLVKKSHDKPRFNSFFDEFLNSELPSVFNRDFSKSQASVNVIETKDSYKIQVAAPGFKKEDLKIKVEDTLLTITGEIKAEKDDNGEKFTRREFNFSSFSRSFNIPETVHSENIKGNHEDGILTIVLPKLEEVKSVTKEIEIL